jgi:hypothetical protein
LEALNSPIRPGGILVEWRCLAAASPLQAMSFAQRLAKKADEFEARKKAEEQKRDAEEAAQIHAWVSGWQKKDTIFASIKNNKTLEKNAELTSASSRVI